RRPSSATRFPYTTRFRSVAALLAVSVLAGSRGGWAQSQAVVPAGATPATPGAAGPAVIPQGGAAPSAAAPATPPRSEVSVPAARSEEHTSELQSPDHLVC